MANLLRLFQLPPTVQKLLSEDRITLGHAKVLLSTPDRAYQESLARKIASDDLSVREVEELVRAREELAGQLEGDRSRPVARGPFASPACSSWSSCCRTSSAPRCGSTWEPSGASS